jgi:hypothetical protein
LRGDRSRHFGGARAWFDTLSLPELLAFLSPLALPPPILSALCGRFVFAAEAVHQQMPLDEFMDAVFAGRVAKDQAIPGRPFAAYRALVSERRDGIHQRHILGAELEGWAAVWMLDGRALHPGPVDIRDVEVADAEDAAAVIEALEGRSVAEGYTQLPRRRLFVEGETLRILEVRADAAGWHLVVRRGRLGHYADKLVERFVSFATETEASTRADELEAELLAAGSSDLRARLTAFKASGVRVQLF